MTCEKSEFLKADGTRRVVITGMGAISPAGTGVDALWNAVYSGKQCIAPITRFDASGFAGSLAAEVPNFDAAACGMSKKEARRFALFVQGAYGNPGLNMLKNEFSPYYIAGVRLSWNFGSLYTLKNDRRVIENKRKQLDSNRDVFLFNTRLEMTQQDQAIRSLEKQMKDDDEIIRLRTNIRKSAEAKVANGTLTVTEMLRELTNESLARQTKAMHEIQRLKGIYQLKYTTNH